MNFYNDNCPPCLELPRMCMAARVCFLAVCISTWGWASIHQCTWRLQARVWSSTIQVGTHGSTYKRIHCKLPLQSAAKDIKGIIYIRTHLLSRTRGLWLLILGELCHFGRTHSIISMGQSFWLFLLWRGVSLMPNSLLTRVGALRRSRSILWVNYGLTKQLCNLNYAIRLMRWISDVRLIASLIASSLNTRRGAAWPAY